MASSQDGGADKQLSVEEVLDLSRHLAAIADAQVPMASGLKALSEDASSRRLKRLLQSLSRRLEQGEPLEEVLADPRNPLPNYLKGAIVGSLRTGRLGYTLERFVGNVQRHADLRRRCWLSVSYPLLLIGMLGTIFAGANLWVIPQFKQLYYGFGVELPGLTVLVLRQAEWFKYLWLPACVVLLGLLCVSLISRFEKSRPFLKAIPLIGPMIHWSALAECYGYLSIFIGEQLPLHVAVHLAKDAMRDSHLARILQSVATDVEEGTKFSYSLQHRIPSSLWPVVAWGEANDGLAETLEVASEIAEQRTFAQAELIRIVCPPMLLIPTVFGVIVCTFGLLLPLIKLLNELGKG